MSIPSSWRRAWSVPAFRVQVVATVVLLPLTLTMLARFLNRVEARHGVVLPDPMLAAFQAHDVTWLTFTIIYGGLFAGIAILLNHPRHLVLAMQTYIGMVIFRIMAMSLVALEPPEGAIPLQDPFVQIFGTGQLLTRDLFFSGHTSTLFLVGLSMPKKMYRYLYFAAAVVVAGCVLYQHDHYTIDVLAAPFFTYGAYRLVCLMHDRALTGTSESL